MKNGGAGLCGLYARLPALLRSGFGATGDAALILPGGRTMNAKRLFLASLILALALASTACGITSVRTEGGELTISVNLSEDQVNGIYDRVITADIDDDFLFEEVSSIDLLEPNIIRAFGTTADGASGSYDVTIDAVDEALQLEVVAVDIPGVTMDDPRVEAANDELAQAFLDSASSGDDGGVAEVAVVNEELIFTVRAPLN
jgi:hypothetical protein